MDEEISAFQQYLELFADVSTKYGIDVDARSRT
jgi:hypothetical protein